MGSGCDRRHAVGGTISSLKLKAFTCAMLVVVAARVLAAAGQGVARGTPASAQPGPDHRSLSLAAPEFSASTLPGLLDTHLAVSVHNGGQTWLSVSVSDFVVSARGDIFGAQARNGGRGGTMIGAGDSRVFRLSFALPRAATKQAALYYRLATGGLGTNPLEGSLRLTQSSPSGSRTQPAIKTRATAAATSQPTVNSFPATGGRGDALGTAIDSAGNIWFAEPGCDFAPKCPASTAPGQIGKLKASSHTFAFFTLPNITGNQPIFLALDGSGNIWFTTPNNSMIGEFNPSTGQFIGQWPVTAGTGPWDLTFAGGKIWYTEHLASAVGSFDPSTHTHQDFQTPSANTNPYGIAANGGLIWFTENNSSVDRIAVLDTTNNNAISEYLIEATLNGHTPHLITIDARGNPWWSEGFSKAIATLNPAAATPGQCGATSGNCKGIQRFLSPVTTNCSTATHVSGIAFQASTGLVWFDNSLTAQVGSFNPSNNTFAMTSLSNCGAHPHDGLNVDGAGNVWWDEEFANALGELIPPAPPTVKTDPASAVGQTTATLNATVNPNGSEVSECKLEYGTTTAYGSSAPCSPAPGSGTSAVSVSDTVSSLTDNTTYHFRILAISAGGPSTGADQTLKTVPSASVVDRFAPLFVQALSLAPRRFGIGKTATAVSDATRHAAPVGTTLRFSLSEPAAVTITFLHAQAGRKVRRTCRSPSRSNAKQKRCTRYAAAGSLRRHGLQGANAISFSGRIGKKALTARAYRASGVARDAAGHLVK